MDKRSVDELSQAYNEWHNDVHGLDGAAIGLSEWHCNALNLCDDLSGIRVLEVGCGTGDFACYLKLQGANVTAVDLSSTAIELAKSRAKDRSLDIEFLVANAQSLPFLDGCFDIVFSCECLEHVPEPILALANFHRVLKRDGLLVITTENYSNATILWWIKCWLLRKPFDSGGGKVQPIEHFFVFWVVRQMITKSGFKVLRTLGSHHVFLVLPRIHPHTFVVERFQGRLSSWLFKPLARHMAFLAVKK